MTVKQWEIVLISATTIILWIVIKSVAIWAYKLTVEIIHNMYRPEFTNAEIIVYKSGTMEPAVTWSDQECAIPNTNPIILNSEGRGRMWV